MQPPLRPRSTLTILGVIAITCLSLAALSYGAPQNPEHKKLVKLKSEISSLQKQLRRSDNKRDKLSTQLRTTELKAADTQRILVGLNRSIAALNTELKTLEKHQKTLKLKKEQQAAVVSKQLSSAYRLGQEEPLKLLFSLESPERLSRIMKYYEYMLEARAKVLLDYQDTLQELDAAEASLRNKRSLLKTAQTKQAQAAKQLLKQVGARKTLLATLNKRLRSDGDHLKKLKLERHRLETIIARVEESIRFESLPTTTPFAGRKGKLPWPVQGKIRHRFGSRRNTDLKWSGWLLSATAASPVKAVHHGRVVFSDYLRGHGLMLIIDHGKGYLSLYAHNQMLLKEIGDWVSSGENIARVGDTGGLARSALYFEIRHQGKAVDPRLWLSPKA